MKKYFMMAIAAAAITSCSQDEVMEVAEKQAINFGNAFVENATRAIDATYNNDAKPKSFLVYGNTQGNETSAPVVPIFKGVTVSSEGTGTVGNDYKYDAAYTQYWIAGNTYNFAAVVHGTVTPNTTTGLPATIAYNATNQEDLLYAEAKNIANKPANGEVGFTFDHLLAKAMFTVKNTMADNTANSIYFYRVSDVQINNAYTTGTYYVEASGDNAAGTWAPATNTLMVDFGNVCASTNTAADADALEIGMNSSAASNYQRVIIPATYTYDETTKTGGLNITCKIETLIKESEDYKVVDVQDYAKTINHTFEKGKAYNFVISLALNEPIMFTVSTINAWDPATNGTDVNL